MQTSASCTAVETGQDCQEFINTNPGCRDFTARFDWSACNLEPRPMIVRSDSSNVKIAKKLNGVTTNQRIAQVKGNLGPRGGDNCDTFGPEFRNYNTCSTEGNVFYSVNVQGTNEDGNYWYECQDFTFGKVVFKEPLAPVAPPTPCKPTPGKGGKGGKGGRGRNNNPRVRGRRARVM